MCRLEKKSVLSSKSERQAWIASLAECLRYASIQRNEFAVELATSVHRTWLEKVLGAQHVGQLRAGLVKHSGACMAGLVAYWLKQANEEDCEKYDQLVRNFWQNIGSTLLTQIGKLSTDPEEIARLVEGHILLAKTLKTSFQQDTRRQHSITFDGDAPSAAPQAPAAAPCAAAAAQLYRHNLDCVVQQLCAAYFELANARQLCSAVLTPLVALLAEFDAPSLFAAIARQFGAPAPYGLYEKVLRTWLAGDTMRCKAVVDVVFLMMKHLSEDEQDAVFDSFQQVSLSVVAYSCRCTASTRIPLYEQNRTLFYIHDYFSK